jgi:Tol biopolymer transport system component
LVVALDDVEVGTLRTNRRSRRAIAVEGRKSRYRGSFAGGLLLALVTAMIPITAFAGNAPGPASVEATEDCVPSGARLVFVRDLGPSIGNEIFTVRPNGTGLKRLTDNLVDEWGPKWSPDGTKIAFSSHRDGNGEIYVMDRTGLDVTRLTENDASDAVPAWSPDGSQIAFASSRDDPTDLDHDLFVMDADGDNVTKVVGSPRTEANPSWSPDGRRIVFDRADFIFTVRSDGTDPKKLTSRRRMLASNPSWSHHGRHILFQAQTSEEKGMDVFLMKRDGSNKRALISTKKEEQNPTWSPNDRRIAFTNHWRVATAKRDGSRPVTLLRHNLADYTLDWGRRVTC